LRLGGRVQRVRLFVLTGILCMLVIAAAPKALVTVEADGSSVVMVTVIADGQEWEWVSSQETAGGILEEAGVTLQGKDYVSPKLHTKAVQGMRIRVTRVTEKIVTQREPVGFKTITRFDPHGQVGRIVVQQGKPGIKEIKYLITYEDGVKTRCKVLDARVIEKPVREIVAVSPATRATALASRAGSHIRCLEMIATAYAPFACGGSRSGRAACGMKAGKGIVAVDPRVITLGTQIYVEGYGYCLAGDVGSAIKGSRIDLGFDTYREAVRFGRRTVKVYILD